MFAAQFGWIAFKENILTKMVHLIDSILSLDQFTLRFFIELERIYILLHKKSENKDAFIEEMVFSVCLCMEANHFWEKTSKQYADLEKCLYKMFNV